ncbi:hypothetical protein TgHK011_009213 [Trichoderma gracile]|nr:hypothetical protein TgHK011_009213 [Trichoderma gracile]
MAFTAHLTVLLDWLPIRRVCICQGLPLSLSLCPYPTRPFAASIGHDSRLPAYYLLLPSTHRHSPAAQSQG